MFDNIRVRFELGCKVLPGILALGMFDDSGYSIVAVAASGDKLVIHNESSKQPLARYFSNRLELSLKGNSSNNYLSVTDKVRSILTVKMKNLPAFLQSSSINEQRANENSELIIESDCSDAPRDILIIGCNSTLLVYDVRMNFDIHYKKLTTSINSLIELEDTSNESRTIVCGTSNGLTSLQLDQSSVNDNNLATFTSADRVQNMITGKLSSRTIVITGSEKGKITVYDVILSGKQLIYSARIFVEESSPIVCLCAIPTYKSSNHPDLMLDHVGYGTTNGMIGTLRLIHSMNQSNDQFDILIERLWMIKTKDEPLCMVLYDIDGDGFDELIVGHKNGRIEVREVFTGEMKHKIRLEKNTRLAGMCVADYCQDDISLLMTCTTDGIVVGYRPCEQMPRQKLINYIAQSNPSRTYLNADDRKTNNMRAMRIFDSAVDILENELGSTNDVSFSKNQNHTLLESLKKRLIIHEELKAQTKELDIRLQDGRDLNSRRDLFMLNQQIYTHVAHDILDSSIVLTVSIRSNVFGFKLLLLKDEKRNLLPDGYLIAVAPESNELMHELETKIRAKDDIECNLDITFVTESKRDHGGQNENFSMSQNFLLPAFSMYALFPVGQDWPDTERLSVTINLPNINYQQIWRWMENKFLCLQILAKRPQEELYDFVNHILNPDNNIDLRLIDLKSKTSKLQEQGKTSPININKKNNDKTSDEGSSCICVSRIEFNSRSNELSIESESIDFLSNVVKSLVIDYLSCDNYNSRSNIRSASMDLNEKTLLAKQYEETDNKILTEFAENSKNLQSLGEQLDMANNLFEFPTSKGILSDLMKMRNDVVKLAKIRTTNYRKQQDIKNQISQLGQQISIINNWPQ